MLRSSRRARRFKRRNRSSSSLAYSSSLKPPTSRNAAASQNMNDPAATLLILLTAFQIPIASAMPGGGSWYATVLPPARQRPARMASAASRKSSTVGVESASTKKIQSPPAQAAPALRARPIWLTGSNTTCAPAPFAISAVRSVELLSHTISSDFQPSRANPSIAARTLESEPGSSRSSLNAGTTTEIFIFLALISAYYRLRPSENGRLTGTPVPNIISRQALISVRVVRQQDPSQEEKMSLSRFVLGLVFALFAAGAMA